jgi:hypothetical protein
MINVFLIISQMPMSYDQLKERYKPQMLYYVNTGRVTYIATCIPCGLDTPLNLPFKVTIMIYKFFLNTSKRICHVLFSFKHYIF